MLNKNDLARINGTADRPHNSNKFNNKSSPGKFKKHGKGKGKGKGKGFRK